GVFAFSERFATVPNPCLDLEGLGTVGIPLSERDARAIISACVPVSGPGRDTDSGIWEMPAEKVGVLCPFRQDEWIQKTAGVAASNALTTHSSVRPLFILKKLMIHDKSSQPISDDESETKIGDFIAVLPGRFEGGQLQLRHVGQTKSLNLAHQSGVSTSIVAAYSGVEHTLSGVTSGYRLSLVYDMVQPITHVEERPALPEMQGATQKMRNIMLSWKQNSSGDAPEWLACLLQHKYAKTANFRAQSLTGADALLVSHLHPLARELKFRIYLAHVEYKTHTSASAPDSREYDSYRRYNCYDDEDDMSDIDEEDFEDDEDEREEYMTVTQVVDLHGMPVQVPGLELEEDDLLNGSIADGEPDASTFERDERTVSTTP
ncbi:hypothetical protein DFH09DRAFT_949436, partial [Mycena vulgaris]